ncbi:hypothetical protein FGG08_001380 [Glutinoglossum americanum]|uniref:Transmembrane and coiled-coil domain-containing protein 4 n=1 Tax=Glutinoglossum americanum TaxID=1670608 RepID=A0A9P8L6A0_9PEZI|nr:hypothetical protein FGG08_001380 [Glutinoglossum americanum]
MPENAVVDTDSASAPAGADGINGGNNTTRDTGSVGVGKSELDEFGLPVRKFRRPVLKDDGSDDETDYQRTWKFVRTPNKSVRSVSTPSKNRDSSERCNAAATTATEVHGNSKPTATGASMPPGSLADLEHPEVPNSKPPELEKDKDGATSSDNANTASLAPNGSFDERPLAERMVFSRSPDPSNDTTTFASEWSHQQIVPQKLGGHNHNKDEDQWQEMPSLAPYDIYDDDNKLIAREAIDSDDEVVAYDGLGGAGKGYTRVNVDEDALSATSMDENTRYLFNEPGTNVADEDEEQRNPLAQMQATKDLLTEGQRIAYVGVCRLAMVSMLKELENIEVTKNTKKEINLAIESMNKWSQKVMVKLYMHMDISPPEQIMIEQLAEHGVVPDDLTPALMHNSRVNNPMAGEPLPKQASLASPHPELVAVKSHGASPPLHTGDDVGTTPPMQYQEHEGDDLPGVRTPSQLPDTKKIDIDLRWTVLCDLFLVLISDSVYDSRSRVLLESVGKYMGISWLEICKFEKRVTDALEMQEAAAKENWNEEEHMENRRKMAVKRKFIMMGLATVGGGLVIGLSAGLLAPVIGAGLAAGFTTIGVAGTSGFLAGTGGAALITSVAATSGGVIAVRASARRFGSVKTFEYRPLHNNKRVNLIVTISGWMNGKVDDVRLPYSTVDPVMGDIYSVLWEPEMLQSMGQTINILATEALTQGLQQVLGSTVLVALMASLQLPIVLTKLSYLIDNPWTVSLDRANSAGLILADSLIDRNLGVRPITLVGYSLGSRVIFACLRELARKGAVGLVQNVYLFGAPIVAKKDEFLRARSVISGRFINGYATNDWILGYLFRATSGGIMRVAGLAPVEEIPGLENIDVTALVPGHMAYRAAMPRLLREVGWAVDSDEFAEIEDPDPENHQARQRELINELEEARKELEKEPKKRKFGFFGRSKEMAKKQDWETYDDITKEGANEGSLGSGATGADNNVLFDVDAIRAELASQQIEVKQLESTLPPMKLDLTDRPKSQDVSSTPRQSKSYDADPVSRTSERSLAPLPALEAKPPLTTQEGGLREYNEYDDLPLSLGNEHVQMTFEPAHHSLPPQRVSISDMALEQPPLKSSVTMSAFLGSEVERNAWLDDDDYEFGTEKEMTMSFE